MKKLLFLFLISLLFSCQNQPETTVQVKGQFKKWHKITLEIKGPETSEWTKENPFLDYKLDVTFTHDSKTYIVPGFYAADGNAEETSAEKGKIWKVHFRPDETGTWNYKISFINGKDIAVKDENDLGEFIFLNKTDGSLEIEDTDKSGNDFRAKGRIVNGGEGYFEFQESGEMWIKNGAGSPENFLAYADFDQTLRFNLKNEVKEGEADPKNSLHKYEPHISDWNEGNPMWQNGKGKGIIGALNYLSSKGVNSVYMLTMNILGDGKDVWPYTDHNERYRFDCSKLDQWEIVFDHMDSLGMMQHFILQETENECLLDGGNTDVQRRLYLRELIARFGHHPAVTWNIGEENGPTGWTPVGQTHEQKVAMVKFMKEINPYPNIVAVHTLPSEHKQDEYLTPFLGFENLDGPSMQISNPMRVHERIITWVNKSEKTGKRWVVNLDEIGPHWIGVMPDSFDANHDTIRAECLWGTLLAGGAGMEWYFGHKYPQNDLTIEDFRSRDKWWEQSTIATQFINNFPLEQMENHDELVNIKGAWCLANPGEVYLIYLPAKFKNAKLQLNGDKTYTVKWLNPRDGGDFQNGSVTGVTGNGRKALGNPPSDIEKDWVVVVQ